MNLVYTVVVDPPSGPGYLNLARLLVSSLIRTSFAGEILVVRNTGGPFFLNPPEHLIEAFISEMPPLPGLNFNESAWSWKYRTSEFIINPERYDRILFLDADCLVLRNIDHLFRLDGDIIIQREPGLPIQKNQFCGRLTEEEMQHLKVDGVNSGSFMIRGEHFSEVMKTWRQIDARPAPRNSLCRDQASWNRLLLDTHLACRPFPQGEIKFPLHTEPNFKDYRKASILHYLGSDIQGKAEFGFGAYAGRFLRGPDTPLVHLTGTENLFCLG